MKSVKNVYLVQLESTYNTDLKLLKINESVFEKALELGQFKSLSITFRLSHPSLKLYSQV